MIEWLGVLGRTYFDGWSMASTFSSAATLGIVLVVLAPGCDGERPVDQCERKKLFRECLDSAPNKAEFQKVHWDEVVKECEEASYAMSVRRVEKYIKKECRR